MIKTFSLSNQDLGKSHLYCYNNRFNFLFSMAIYCYFLVITLVNILWWFRKRKWLFSFNSFARQAMIKNHDNFIYLRSIFLQNYMFTLTTKQARHIYSGISGETAETGGNEQNFVQNGVFQSERPRILCEISQILVCLKIEFHVGFE